MQLAQSGGFMQDVLSQLGVNVSQFRRASAAGGMLE
jgi:hypothetical protein